MANTTPTGNQAPSPQSPRYAKVREPLSLIREMIKLKEIISSIHITPLDGLRVIGLDQENSSTALLVDLLNTFKSEQDLAELKQWIVTAKSIKSIDDAEKVWWIGESDLHGHCVGNENYFYVSPPLDFGPSLLMHQKSFEFRIGYNWQEPASVIIDIDKLEALLEDWLKVISAFAINYREVIQKNSQTSSRSRSDEIYKRIKDLIRYLPSDEKVMLLQLIEKMEQN